MKLHKKITFGLLALTLVGPMTSCSDFLDEELTTQQNTDFFDTQEGIDRLEPYCCMCAMALSMPSTTFTASL